MAFNFSVDTVKDLVVVMEQMTHARDAFKLLRICQVDAEYYIEQVIRLADQVRLNQLSYPLVEFNDGDNIYEVYLKLNNPTEYLDGDIIQAMIDRNVNIVDTRKTTGAEDYNTWLLNNPSDNIRAKQYVPIAVDHFKLAIRAAKTLYNL